jgi:hypothetical protein
LSQAAAAGEEVEAAVAAQVVTVLLLLVNHRAEVLQLNPYLAFLPGLLTQ